MDKWPCYVAEVDGTHWVRRPLCGTIGICKSTCTTWVTWCGHSVLWNSTWLDVSVTILLSLSKCRMGTVIPWYRLNAESKRYLRPRLLLCWCCCVRMHSPKIRSTLAFLPGCHIRRFWRLPPARPRVKMLDLHEVMEYLRMGRSQEEASTQMQEAKCLFHWLYVGPLAAQFTLSAPIPCRIL